MITSSILYLLYYALYWLTYPLRALSDASLPAGVASAIATAGSYLAIVSYVAEVPALLLVFAFVMVVENAHFFYKIIMWAVHKIPGIT